MAIAEGVVPAILVLEASVPIGGGNAVAEIDLRGTNRVIHDPETKLMVLVLPNPSVPSVAGRLRPLWPCRTTSLFC